MAIHLFFLADRCEFIQTVAEWYFQEWGHYTHDNSLEKTVERINGKLNKTHPPLHIIAELAGRPVGVGQLKIREMKEFPEREFWLGSVYVPNEFRGQGIASVICDRITEVAKSFEIKQLYLQTEQLDGGLYARLGWTPMEKLVSHGVPILVMSKLL